MSQASSLIVVGEALMDCISQPDGTLLPLMGGSPYNMARAAALQGAQVGWLTPFSTDKFGDQLAALAEKDGVQCVTPRTQLPTSLAVVNVVNGQPSYGFYREGIADRDYTVDAALARLRELPVGVLHTGSLHLIPPESDKVLSLLDGARALGWTISVDINLRPVVAPDLPSYVNAVWDVVARADWVKASDEDLETMGIHGATYGNAAETLKAFAKPNNRFVALTFGGDGAFLSVNGQTAQSRAPNIDVTDTVGAGDTFWGNCLADWIMHGAEGAPNRVAHTLKRAMQAAAINCTRKGCQPPTAAEVDVCSL